MGRTEAAVSFLHRAAGRVLAPHIRGYALRFARSIQADNR